MRRVNVTTVGQVKDPAAQSAIKALVQASAENDLLDVANAFTIQGTFTEIRTLNVTSPTLSNLAAVLATFIADCQRGGQNRTT